MPTARPASAIASGIDQLIAELRTFTEPIPYPTLILLLEQNPIGRPELSTFVQFGDDCYRRNRIHLADHFEMLALCWKSGQRSPIHDHTGSACAVRVIEGIASETTFERSPSGLLYATGTTHMPADTVCGSFDADIHQMGNLQTAPEDLVTLHIYSPPLRRMKTYFCGDAVMGEYSHPLEAVDRARSGRLVSAIRRHPS